MSQINFPFKVIPSLGREDFIVTDSNKEAILWFDKWPNWPNGLFGVYGSSGSGKTHLVQCWASISEAFILKGKKELNINLENLNKIKHIAVDDASYMNEQYLFHIINIVQQNNKTLFLTADVSPAQWNVNLPDLRSRLRSIPSIKIKNPDDALLKALLTKLFRDRQIDVTDDLNIYIIKRIERSFYAVQSFVDKIDNLTMSQKRKITKPVINKVLLDCKK